MSVFGMGVAATDALFLEFIYPGLTSEIRENTVLVDRFGTDTETCLGKYSVFKALTAAPASARSERPILTMARHTEPILPP